MGTYVYLDAIGVPFPDHWGSAHTSGAQFLFADGSVRTITYSTPNTQVLKMLTPSGGEVISWEN